MRFDNYYFIFLSQDLTLDKREIEPELLGEDDEIDGDKQKETLPQKDAIESSETKPSCNKDEQSEPLMEVDEEEKEPASMLHELYKDESGGTAGGARHLRCE